MKRKISVKNTVRGESLCILANTASMYWFKSIFVLQKLFKESVRVTEIITPNWTICYRLPAIIALADGNVKFCSNAFTDIRTMHPLDHEAPSAQPVEGWMQHQHMRLMPRLRQIARQRQPASARRRIIKTRGAEKDNTHAILFGRCNNQRHAKPTQGRSIKKPGNGTEQRLQFSWTQHIERRQHPINPNRTPAGLFEHPSDAARRIGAGAGIPTMERLRKPRCEWYEITVRYAAQAMGLKRKPFIRRCEQQCSAITQDTPHLTQCNPLVRDVLKRFNAKHDIKNSIAERQPLTIRLRRSNRWRDTRLTEEFIQPASVDINTPHQRCDASDLQRVGAVTATHVERPCAPPGMHRLEGSKAFFNPRIPIPDSVDRDRQRSS
jgi:hypothetical protein